MMKKHQFLLLVLVIGWFLVSLKVYVIFFYHVGVNLASLNGLLDTPRLFTQSAGNKEKTTIAFAVSVTSYDPESHMLDRAAILQQSIKLAMKRSTRYDYHLYAFVHPDAEDTGPTLEQLGYRVQNRDTPFNLSAVPNQDFIDAQNIGCCGEKEYIKLYTWLLLGYPVVIHLDLDVLVLRPMDDLFDIMAKDLPNHRNTFQNASMWTDMSTYDGPIDFLFTRDYNMVSPPSHQPHQIGVQGGFLVVRPSMSDFQKYVDTIVSGEHFKDSMWGGSALGFGGYYGVGTIQGLASYYYGHLQQNRSIELNRCYYNSMADNPYDFNKELNMTLCMTNEPNLTCQDCRETPIEDIFTFHFTAECGKPEWCSMEHAVPLCMEMFYKWHETRISLEEEWSNTFESYIPHRENLTEGSINNQETLEKRGGHCSRRGKYLPLSFPSNVTGRLV